MRALLTLGTILTLASALGCTPARYRDAEGRQVAHGSTTDAWMEGVDGGMIVMGEDAATPAEDAFSVPGEDAWVVPGHDAAVPLPDASGHAPDAWSAPDAYSGSCPTYTGSVQALYAMHCANCHTTGSDPRFGSSYTVANRNSSSCGGSEAACTIQLGRPGGSMARRDPYGGFSTADIALIQSWIDCGRPM